MEQTVDMQEDGWVYFKESPRGETRKHAQKNKTKPADNLRLSCYYTTLITRACLPSPFLPSRLCIMDFPDPKQL